ncbi:hypothetical protein GM415_08410 [Pseudodesulfovibrio cashew]|uniref:Ppx/GppA phosphatase N-terminal domain-containing protein n=1 Tax=Pseudodesulfovibrio cashew TaxID=2678688 RepID=A0A6I6JGK3_9BACT|nr:hypothetical protein [Pseudodesulfovibrio cashew]QGY40148.1 hypothetical protein GM415_08410 [Pseudodesulfovibrio cashew]
MTAHRHHTFQAVSGTIIRAGLFLCLLLLLFPALTMAAESPTVIRRAALDIGSAVTKCTVADVNPISCDVVKIVQRFSVKVDYAEDMARSYDGNLSKDILEKGMKAVKELKRKALALGTHEFSAVGGPPFREARNGKAFFALIQEETGFAARIVSEQQASLLSYQSVQQHASVASPDLLVWDIGGDDQTMTVRANDGSLVFHIDKMASVSFKNAVISAIQGRDINTVSSPNPMSANEVERGLELVEAYAMLSVEKGLANRIRNGKVRVVGIGGVHYHAVPELLGQRGPAYTRLEVEEALSRWTGKSDEAFNSEYADTRLTNLILVLGYMRALDIETIAPLKVNQADGLLISPDFW